MEYDEYLITGISCLIAAIVGGGLKVFGIEIPLLNSMKRQVLLGLLGMALISPTAGSQIKTLMMTSGCKDYANIAVEQYKENLSLKCNLTGLRWHDNYDGHFGWCKTQPLESIANENDIRKKALASCG